MKFLYPCNPLNNKEADEPYQDEFDLMKSIGYDCYLFDFDLLTDFDDFKTYPRIKDSETIIYRGWMLTPSNYQKLEQKIVNRNSKMLTTSDNYIASHYIESWYEKLKNYTPKTRFVDSKELLEKMIASLNWNQYFVKDQVKSNNDEMGSIANNLEEVKLILEKIETYRGSIEGKISLREVESFITESEERFFVYQGKPYSNKGEIPEILNQIAERINLPFFSIDLIKNEEGEYRLVEIGDGQVSDKKSWDLNNFVNIFKKDS